MDVIWHKLRRFYKRPWIERSCALLPQFYLLIVFISEGKPRLALYMALSILVFVGFLVWADWYVAQRQRQKGVTVHQGGSNA